MKNYVCTPTQELAAVNYLMRQTSKWFMNYDMYTTEITPGCCPGFRYWAGEASRVRHFRTKKHTARFYGITVPELNHAIKIVGVLRALEAV